MRHSLERAAVVGAPLARACAALLNPGHVCVVVGELLVGAALDSEVVELDADAEGELDAGGIVGGLQLASVGPPSLGLGNGSW